MTTTNVDLDQFFNIFDRPTRKALQDFYKGGQRQYAGRAEAANRGLRYLSPQLAASSRLFAELRHDPPVLERFLVDSSRFVTALSSRRDDLSALIANLNSTTRGLGSEEAALSEAITRFPPFLRQANSTYVNLRAALDDLDPLVNASKPVARKLRPYLGELRPLARDAVPTVRNLRRTVRRPGGANDLRELQQTYPKLEEVALVERRRNGADRRGAFPELSEALRGSAPIIAHGRPYTTDLFGWFDDFSHTGASDALGSFSRVQTYVNAFTVQNGLPTNLIPLADRTERCSARWPGCARSSAARAAPRCPPPTAPTCSAPSSSASWTAASPTGPRGTCPDAPAAHGRAGPGRRRRRGGAGGRPAATARARPTRSSSTAASGWSRAAT